MFKNVLITFLIIILMFPVVYAQDNMVIVTTSKYVQPNNFVTTINNYINVLKKDNITATFKQIYYKDTPNAEQFRKDLNNLVIKNNAKYIILIGDTTIIPYATIKINKTLSISSDMLYTDTNYDNITEENISLGRIPSGAVIDYLNTAIKVHNNKGVRFEKSEEFINTQYLYSDWIKKIVNTTNIILAGHGTSRLIQTPQYYNGTQYRVVYTMYAIDLPTKYNLNKNNPIIRAQYPCNIAKENTPGTWGTQLLKYGASGLIAKTTTQGLRSEVEDKLYNNINNNLSFAQSYYKELRTIQLKYKGNDYMQEFIWHMEYFGDPSIKKKII